MLSPSPNKAFVLFTKMQNMGSAFFAELDIVRKSLGNDREFAKWCATDLGLPLSAITRMADVLQRVDAERTKHELASARAAERTQKAERRKPTNAETARVNQLLARIRELEAQVAVRTPPRTAPLRDRADYMREYMRKRRAAQKDR
jgi:hypothetical protein